MSNPEEKQINLSKRKLLLLTGGSIVFVLIGAWMLMLDVATIESYRRFNNPTITHSIGFLSVVLFSLMAFLYYKKVSDNQPGLVFSPSGIAHNSSIFSSTFIPWTDIAGSDITKKYNQKLLMISLKQPEKYIECSNVWMKTLNTLNQTFYGSPITILTNTLETDIHELSDTFNDYFAQYETKNSEV